MRWTSYVCFLSTPPREKQANVNLFASLKLGILWNKSRLLFYLLPLDHIPISITPRARL